MSTSIIKRFWRSWARCLAGQTASQCRVKTLTRCRPPTEHIVGLDVELQMCRRALGVVGKSARSLRLARLEDTSGCG